MINNEIFVDHRFGGNVQPHQPSGGQFVCGDDFGNDANAGAAERAADERL